jgi:23S rRNA G2445 N2-methylase RlmL
LRFDVVVACAVGLEDLVTEELGELGHEAEPVKPANLLVRDVDSEGVVSLNYLTRQATRVFLMAWVGEAASPEDIRACSAEVDYTQYMAADQTFGVKGVRVGEHDFTSTDIGAYVGAAVVDCFQARHGVRVRANLDAPDVQFYAELRDSHFMITVNTTGDSLIRRHRRPYQHFAPMRPNLAATLLRMSSFDKGVSTLDPMAGGGTISTEACMMARDMPAGYFRDKWAFERLRCIDDGVFAQVRDRALSSIVPSETKIGACDKYLRSVEGMRGNLTAQGLADDIHTWEDMAETLAGVEVGEYDTLVTNPPYGVRIGNPRVVRRLYDAFPKAAMDKGIREIVVTTPRQANICNALTEAGYEVVEQRQFLYGGLWSWIVRAVAPGTAAS